jgi:hypothetical protein
LNEKTQPIQWTERPTGALVAVNSLWPSLIWYLCVWYLITNLGFVLLQITHDD